MSELNGAVNKLVRAIEEPGPHPKIHASIMRQHRKEWPILWDAIDAILEAKQEDERYTPDDFECNPNDIMPDERL